MTTRKFSEEEIEEYVFEERPGARVLKESDNGDGRWTRYMTTVFQTEDGKIYETPWERGLTEGQDNIFYDQELDELKEIVVSEASVSKHYLPLTSELQPFTLDEDIVETARIVSGGDVDVAIEALKNFDVQNVIDFLKLTSPLFLDNESFAHAEVAHVFFDAIKKYQQN